MARSSFVFVAASLLVLSLPPVAAGCAGESPDGETTDSDLTADPHARAKLTAGLDLIARKASSVEIVTTPVSHVYAGGQLIKRKGEPSESFLVEPAVIRQLLDAVTLPETPPDCGAKLPTSETTVVFRDDTKRTLGTVFFDSNHCRDWAGVPEDDALYVLLNMGVAVDQAKVDAALAPLQEETPLTDAPPAAPDDPSGSESKAAE